jgi:hypothetical protein
MASLLSTFLNCALPTCGALATRPDVRNTPIGPIKFFLQIARQKQAAQGTLGILSLNGSRLCFTLERPWRENEQTVSRVPAGTYPAVIRYERSDMWRLQLRDVPGLPGIRMHIGDDPPDAKACMLIGNEVGPDGQSVTSSAAAHSDLRNRFYGSDQPIMTPGTAVSVTLVDEFPTSYSTYLHAGQWKYPDGARAPLRTSQGRFEVSQEGTCRLTWSAARAQPATTIDFYDFDVVDFNGGLLFTIRTIAGASFGSGHLEYDSGDVADVRIAREWHKIAGIGPQRGRERDRGLS